MKEKVLVFLKVACITYVVVFLILFVMMFVSTFIRGEQLDLSLFNGTAAKVVIIISVVFGAIGTWIHDK